MYLYMQTFKKPHHIHFSKRSTNKHENNKLREVQGALNLFPFYSEGWIQFNLISLTPLKFVSPLRQELCLSPLLNRLSLQLSFQMFSYLIIFFLWLKFSKIFFPEFKNVCFEAKIGHFLPKPPLQSRVITGTLVLLKSPSLEIWSD